MRFRNICCIVTWFWHFKFDYCRNSECFFTFALRRNN